LSKRQLDQAGLERRNKQRRLILGAVIVAVFAGVMAAFALSSGSQPGGREPAVLKTAGSDNPSNELGGEVTAVEEGNPFPTFSLTEADGRTLTNDSRKGKPRVVHDLLLRSLPARSGPRLPTRR